MPLVASSDLITTVEEARDYYRANLGGIRRVTCAGRKIEVFFAVDVIHLYSEAVPANAIPAGAQVLTQQVGVGKSEVRIFSLKRARLMDHVLRAISLFTVSTSGNDDPRLGTRVLDGPRLPTGEYMRVALRPGRDKTMRCVSAYPVSERAHLEAWNSKRAKFPP